MYRPRPLWHHSPFCPGSTVTCIQYVQERHNRCRFLGPQSHQFLSDPSHCIQQLSDQDAKWTPFSPLCRDSPCATVWELDAILCMIHAWRWPWQLWACKYRDCCYCYEFVMYIGTWQFGCACGWILYITVIYDCILHYKCFQLYSYSSFYMHACTHFNL